MLFFYFDINICRKQRWPRTFPAGINFTKLVGCKYIRNYLVSQNIFRTGADLKTQEVVIFNWRVILNLFFMVGDVDPFSTKPVLDLIVTAYDHKAVIAVLIYELMV